jgi:competence protein ComEC
MEVFALRPRKPFLGLALSAIAGIAVADWFSIPTVALAILVVVGVAVGFFRPVAVVCWVTAALVFALLHTARHVDNSARLFGASLDKPRTFKAEGVVWSEPVEFANAKGKGKDGGTFWLKIEQCEPAAPVVGQLCLARWSAKPPVYGDRVRISGTAQRIEPPRNPGQFDVSQWLSRQGVYFEVETDEARHCEILGHDAGSPLRGFGIAGRAWIKAALNAGLPEDPETSTLINSMVLGLRGDSPDELKELFQETGTLHLFAVSGLNVAMLIMILSLAFRVCRVRGKFATLVIIPCLAAYAIIVGLSASCTRATVVGIAVLAATFWERDSIPLNSLGAAAFAILACETNELFNPGFQLSFILVLVIMAFSRPLQKRMEKAANPDDFIPRRLWTKGQQFTVWIGANIAEMLAVGLTAWGGSVLLMWGYFHLISPIGMIANLAAVPLAFFILALGLLSLFAGAFWTAAGVVVNQANWACAQLLIGSVKLSAQIPHGHQYIEWPGISQKPVCEIVALDVGDGAAIHLRTPASDWLIDAGHQRDYPRVLLPYLRSRGVDRLDGLWITHGDASHVGGAAALMSDFHPGWIGEVSLLDRSSTHRALHAELAARQIGRRFFWRGDEAHLDHETRMRVLYPPRELPQQNLADDKSLVLRLEAGGRRILFTADVGFSVEEWLLKNEPDLQSDVLVKGWAGRDFSGTPDFVRAVNPCAIVCAAQDYGADDQRFEEWAQPMRKAGIKIFPQAKDGAVRIAIEHSGDVTVAPWMR